MAMERQEARSGGGSGDPGYAGEGEAPAERVQAGMRLH
jgi:hypothetical protein